MTVLSRTFSLARGPLTSTLRSTNVQNQIQTVFIISRNVSSLIISKNMELFSNKKINAKVNNLKLSSYDDRPLVVMLSWLMSKRKPAIKYSELYFPRGFDVLNVTVTPWQLLWPKKGSQNVARDLLEFLSINNNLNPLFLHGFSVGAYVWSEALVQIAQEKDRYQPIVDRIIGQVWDSAADITEIPVGVPYAVFPKNKVMQTALRKYMLYHLKTFHKVATIHYVRGSQMFHTNLVKSPVLFFLSKTDPIGAFSSNMRVRESWESMGIPVDWKCWDRSPHVGHFRKHPEEYKEELNAFLDRICVAKADEMKIQMQN